MIAVRRSGLAWLRIGACALVGVLASGCGYERGGSSDAVLRVGVIAPSGERGDEALQGAQLGAEEAGRAADLVGRRFELLTARASDPEATVGAARRMARQGAFAIVGGFDEGSCRALAEVAAREEILFLNVGCRADALRENGQPYAFHVEASEAMYQVARAGGGDSAASAVLWHPELTRYGAAQLNERFERRFGAPPGPAAWASWMAVKVLWESALRADAAGPGRIAASVAGGAGYDGHKGEPLVFDSADHQLRQPLYQVTAAGALASSGGGDPTGAEGQLATGSGEPPGEGRLALISNEGSETVSIINTTTNQVASTIPVGARPRGIHVSPDGQRGYVALSDHAPTVEGDRDAIAVIDIRAGKVIGAHPGGTDPEQFAVSPDGRRLYAANEDAGTASIVDLRDGRVLATLVVGIEPEGVAISPDGRWVYVTAETSNTVSVIDAEKNEVVASFLVDVRPRAAVFSPSGSRAYVTNEISGTVSVVDVGRHEVVDVISLPHGAKPVGVVVSPDGRRVYVANGSANTVSVIDAATNQVIESVRVGGRPWGLEITPDGRWVYTANGVSDDVSVLDTTTNEVVERVKVGERPWGVAITP